MKVYFSATLTEDEELKNNYAEIIKILKKHGHDILQYGSDQLSPSQLVNRTDNEIEKTYKNLDKMMRQAEVLITEITEPSVGIGYEIAQAITEKKPVLALVSDKAEFQPLATIEGNNSKYISYVHYKSADLEKIIKKFLKEAKTKIDTKFILIISPEIDRYISWASEERRLHKAQIVRNAVEEAMEKDEEYRNHLKDLGLAS